VNSLKNMFADHTMNVQCKYPIIQYTKNWHV